MPIIETDTAGAAKKLSEEKNMQSAVIASELAAKIYDLEVIEKNFEDISGNTTRFLIMSSDNKDFIAIDKKKIHNNMYI